MGYRDRHGVRLDIALSGRGMQQTLLLLAYLAANPQSALLLDEPDAHLEILRQKQIYQVLSEWAREQGGQIIIATHSEVILNEAAGRDAVVAFLGRPHRIDNQTSHLSKVRRALTDLGFDQYLQAEQTGWVLYLEGSSDLAIMRSLAKKLEHPAFTLLEKPFVHYVTNLPGKAHGHFFALQEAKPDLVGFALFDRLNRPLEEKPGLAQRQWRRNEVENYFCLRDVLTGWAKAFGMANTGPLLSISSEKIMEESVAEIESARRALDEDPWGPDIKASDEVFKPIFRKFFSKMKLPNLMEKSSYYGLVDYIRPDEIDPEVKEALDQISQVAASAKPAG